MKDTGIIRHVDELGRITLPIELRRSLSLEERDPVHVYVDGNKIILEKEDVGDIFTGSTKDLIEYHGKMISLDTIKELARIAEIKLK